MATFPNRLADRAAITIARTARLVNNAHQRLNTLGSQVSQAGGQIGTLNGQMTTAQSGITANTSGIAANSSAITALQDGGTFQPMSGFSNSFSASGTLEYRSMPGGFVYVSGSVTLPGGSSVYNDVVFFTMGSGYIPAAQRNWPCVPNSGTSYGNATYQGAPTCFIEDDGTMRLWGVPGSLNGDSVNISGVYSL